MLHSLFTVVCKQGAGHQRFIITVLIYYAVIGSFHECRFPRAACSLLRCCMEIPGRFSNVQEEFNKAAQSKYTPFAAAQSYRCSAKICFTCQFSCEHMNFTVFIHNAS